MSNINRDYLIVLNPKTSKVTVPELNYYIYDKYTANLFVNLVTVENGKVVNMVDADQYKLVLHVVKPTNEIQTVEDIQVFNKEKALFQIELDAELTKNIGRYKCELLTIDKTDHIVQSAKFSYRVKKSIYNDLDVVTETPQYPIIITLLDKLQDIDKYEEERRANEVARVAAEKARVKDYTDLRETVTTDINTMQEKIDSFDGKVQEVDSAVQEMRTNITDYQTEKNKELDSYKTQKDTQINTAIKGMETTIDKYKTEKDTEINEKITQQDTKIDSAIQDQNNTIAANNQAQNKVISDAVAAQNKTINTVVESDKEQNDRLDNLENADTNNKAEIKKLQDKDVAHDERMTAIETVNVEQNNRLDAIEIKNDQQDSRLNDVEAKNKKQDLDLKCLFAESHSERITLDDEVGNSIFLQNSKQGFATVDELNGNTLVNCNKDVDKELILNGNIDTSGYGTVTTTEGVDGGKVDVALEGNTMVNVCDQEEPVAITKNYEVTTGNHVALQGEYDGKCRPNITGNTLWINNDTNEILTEFDETKNLRLQSSFEDKLITDEKDAHNGKYKVDYKVTGKNKFGADNITYTVIGEDATYGTTTKTGNSFTYQGNKDKANSNYGIKLTNIKLKPNTTYALTYNYKNTNADKSCFLKVYIAGSNQIAEGDLTTFTTVDNEYYTINFYGTLGEKVNCQFTISNIQIEEGTKATTYEPYKESIKTLYLNSPLLEGDTIEQSGNDIVHVHRYKKVVLDGTQQIHYLNAFDKDNTVFFHYISNVGSYTDAVYCDKLSYIRDIDIYDMEGIRTNRAIQFRLNKNKFSSTNYRNEITTYLQQNPITVVCQVQTPTREVISTNDNLLLDSYVNGHLDVDSVVPIDKVVFGYQYFKLVYLYPSTQYIVQFESDNVGKLDRMALGVNGYITEQNITKGINKFNITTGDSIGYGYLDIYGIGFNMSKVVVTPKVDGDFGYFKGMKSVGQNDVDGNKIEILSSKYKANHLNNSQCVYFNPNNTGLGLSTLMTDESERYYRAIADEGRNVSLYGRPSHDYSYGEEYIYSMMIRTQKDTRVTIYENNHEDETKNTISVKANEWTTISTKPTKLFNLNALVLIADEVNCYVDYKNVKLEKGKTVTPWMPSKNDNEYNLWRFLNKKEILMNEPLRGLPNGTKDKYVIIDGKWYIERNCGSKVFVGSNDENWLTCGVNSTSRINTLAFSISLDNLAHNWISIGELICDKFKELSDGDLYSSDIEGINSDSNGGGRLILAINKSKLSTQNVAGFKQWLQQNPTTIVYQLATPTYEPIDYNPFEVYTDTTHISNNSIIPCNMIIRNSGFNCILKPNTTYTVSSNNGLSSVTTKDSIGDGILRFYDKDTTSVTKMGNVLVLEGDYITGNPPIPAFFKGIESAFEQELVTDEKDKNYGKYKVNVKATNPDNSQQNNITFYLKEPLRGIGDVKDKVYVKEDKVVVERNCGHKVLDGTETSWQAPSTDNYKYGVFTLYMPHLNHKEVKMNDRNEQGVLCNTLRPYWWWTNNDSFKTVPDNSIHYLVWDNSDTFYIIKKNLKTVDELKQWLEANKTEYIYPLATPVYEEVEYFDMKLFVEIFKNTTIIYNSNIPVTSTINYTYATPLTDAVNTVSDISDQQDSMIIDMATQVATMQMMLM